MLSQNVYTQYKIDDLFETIYFIDTEIPFLHFKMSLEEYYYYFNRFKASISQLEFIPLKLNPKLTKIAIIANSFEDMKLSQRILSNFSLLKNKGTQVFVIPVGFDWHLNKEQSLIYHQFIANNFDLLISLGGDDIHPNFYQQKNFNSLNVFFDRDKSEMSLVKFYKANSPGVFLGICRGHQLSAVIDGYELIQDLSEIKPECLSLHLNNNKTPQEYVYHDVIIRPSLLTRLLGFKTTEEVKIPVNSYHHQAVKNKSNHDNFCVAYDSEHDIIEALVSKNKRSISVQFHPELPNEINKNDSFTELGHSFIKRVIAYSRLVKKSKFSLISKNQTLANLSDSKTLNSDSDRESYLKTATFKFK